MKAEPRIGDVLVYTTPVDQCVLFGADSISDGFVRGTIRQSTSSSYPIGTLLAITWGSNAVTCIATIDGVRHHDEALEESKRQPDLYNRCTTCREREVEVLSDTHHHYVGFWQECQACGATSDMYRPWSLPDHPITAKVALVDMVPHGWSE